MAVYDMPAWLRAASFEWGLDKAGAQFSSPYNRAVQAVDFAAHQWLCSITIPPRLWQDAGAPEAFLANLAGGVHRLRVPHLGRRSGEPKGTLRGAPTLASAMAAGSRTMALANARGPVNLVPWSAFQANTAGLCSSLFGYSVGTTGSVSHDIGSDAGIRYQRSIAAALGSASTDRFGWGSIANIPVSAGQAYTWSFQARNSGVRSVAYIDWYNGSSYFANASTAAIIAEGAWGNVSITATAPAGTIAARLYAWGEGYSSAGFTRTHDVRLPQFEPGTSRSTYDGPATVLSGDMLGAGGQLFMALTDAQAADDASMQVATVNAARVQIASGQGVTWQAPTCQMMMPASSFRTVHVPGLLQAITVDLIEAP